MEVHRLYELNEFIKRIVALNFPQAIWVKGEIAQADQSRGHYFIDVIEKSGEDIIARADAVIWQKTYHKLYRQLGKQLESLIQEGVEIMVKARVDFHERYGYKLIIEDIDPAFTLGQLEAQKRETLEKLYEEKLLGKNKSQLLPAVIQKVAVLSSEKAAGLQDFIYQMKDNLYGYHFDIQVFECQLQGTEAPGKMVRQLHSIQQNHERFDCAVIIRGGGAKIDLAPFNDYELCKKIAKMPLPVLVGIGHETDESLADQVAHSSLKTPTAVAEFLINHNLTFESQVVQLEQQLRWIAQQQLNTQQLALQRLEEMLYLPIQRQIAQHYQQISYLEGQLQPLVSSLLQKAIYELRELEGINKLLTIENTLARGYSLTYRENEIIRHTKELNDGDQIHTRLQHGQLISIVKKENQSSNEI